MVIFITDKKNKATLNQINRFQKNFIIKHSERVKFLFWQDLFKNWPQTIEKPFQYSYFKE